MSQQSLNAQQAVQIVRRHKILVATLAVIGMALGAAYSVLSPPLLTSQALVALPPNAPNIATEAVIAQSEPVLSRALPAITPSISLQTLEDRVTAKSVTPTVISISAEGKTAAQAEGTANAVANSYIAVVANRQSPAGSVLVKTIEPATTATGMSAPEQDALDAGLGLLVGLILGIIAAIVVGRRRGRRLVQLDEIAYSIRVPVLAAAPVGHPADAAGWTRLLYGYEPRSVEAWRLRQALEEIAAAGSTANNQSASSVTVLSMPSDPRALALGPQLAAFAASLGIPTVLVVGPQQDTNSTAALSTACAAPRGSAAHSNFLHTIAADTRRVVVPAAAKLVVVVAVAEGKTPQIPDTMPTAATVLGVTSGVATAEQLARLAMAAAADGRDVIGLFVANPDPADQTTGRMPVPSGQRIRSARTSGPAPEPRPAHESGRPAPEPRPVHESGRPAPEPRPVHEPDIARGSRPRPNAETRLDLGAVPDSAPESAKTAQSDRGTKQSQSGGGAESSVPTRATTKR